MQNNLDFIYFNLLNKLKTNRFALNHLTNDEFLSLKKWLLDKMNVPFLTNQWYLIGTDGCHLCEQVDRLITQVSYTHSTPKVVQIDLAEHEDLVDVFGVLIPILITERRMLCYPFGIMDIMAQI